MAQLDSKKLKHVRNMLILSGIVSNRLPYLVGGPFGSEHFPIE